MYIHKSASPRIAESSFQALLPEPSFIIYVKDMWRMVTRHNLSSGMRSGWYTFYANGVAFWLRRLLVQTRFSSGWIYLS